MKEKILALDVGKVKIGLATSDNKLIIATPLKTLVRAKNKALKEIIETISSERVTKLVVGLPLNEDNSETNQCVDIRNFVRRIKRRVSIKVEFIDEAFSTLRANEIIRQQKLKHKDDDAIAAALILQKYLESC